jgi:UDP-N-acetylmuramoylalanine--D-glutamate ligase
VSGQALVVGFAVTGQAAARALVEKGRRVVALDDGEVSVKMARAAEDLGVELVSRPPKAKLAELAEKSELVVLSPGVPPSHLIFALAEPDKIVAEVELAFSLAERPVLAITGTNGKTTVTSLVTAILTEAGRKPEAVGNIGRPFIEAVGAGSADVYVAELSSFQLAWTKTFRPAVACWLNLAEDHLDWHADMAEYGAAKARIWANQERDDVAVVNADDPVVMSFAASAPSRLVTFGEQKADLFVADGVLVSPAGPICAVSELPRQLPHDVANAAAASAVAMAAGAGPEDCAAALRAGVAMPHRIELVAQGDGVFWYDDSKATTPSAVLAALCGFDQVVLIAGGRNKGLSFSAILEGLEEESRLKGGPGKKRLRGVVAIGESAGQVVEAFADAGVEVVRAGSMAEAVAAAAALSTPGTSVLLSPGAASFDWYRNYGERGEDFARLVKKRLEEGSRDE